MPRTKKISKQVEVSVHKDHLKKLSKARRPLQAIQELIWNSLDADADHVEVIIERNLWGGVQRIAVVDDGVGMLPKKAFEVFERLGGSWKQDVETTEKGRKLHGKEGKGRFAAFSLGADVSWSSVAQDPAGIYTSCRIESTDQKLDRFLITGDLARSNSQLTRGTKVTIGDVPETVHGLIGDAAVTAMHDKFALYLVKYPRVKIIYDGEPIEAQAAISALHKCSISVDVDGETHAAEVDIVEWKRKGPRGIYLCDRAGFSMHDVAVGVRTNNRRITAHIKSASFEALQSTGGLSIGDLHPTVRGLLNQTRKQISDYYDSTAMRAAAERIQGWRDEQVYPFGEPPRDPVQAAQQQAFFVLANEAEERIPELRTHGTKAKRLLFRLLRDAIERGAEQIRTIFAQVLDLTEAQQNELAELLDKVSHASIVASAKVVAS